MIKSLIRKNTPKIKLTIFSIIKIINLNNIFTNSIRFFFCLNKFRITCVQIHITNKCNLNCIYCYAKNHEGKLLSKEKILSLIDEAKKNNVHEIQFVGGEPFLYLHFKELIEYTVKKGLNIRIYTNGTVIDKSWINYLKKFRKKVILIFKFDSKEGFLYHTGQDLHDKTMRIIKNCRAHNLETNTFIMLTKKNFAQAEQLIRKSFDMGIIPIIERYLPACSHKINKSLEITPIEWGSVLVLFKKYYKEYLVFYEIIAKLFGFYCSCYNSAISIDTDGEALPCPYAPKALSIGNVKEKSLSEIFRIYSRKKIEWNRIPEECSCCKNVDLCKGGCKTYAFMKNKKFWVKDSLCAASHPNRIPPNITMCAFNNTILK